MARAFLPGWGSTAAVWEPFGSGGVGIAPGVEVVGWSLGAMRALEAAARMELAGLVLVAATPQFVRLGAWRHGWPPRALEAMRRRIPAEREELLDEFEALMVAPGEARPALPHERDPAALAEGLDYIAGFSMLERLDAVRCPVRLLHGRLDRVVPLAAAEHLAATLPDADLTVWDDAGHAPHLTQPDRFRAWIA